nr:hypothetical protein [uncultured Campylobacter sp.]
MGASGLLKQAEWIARAGLNLRKIANARLKFSLLTVLLWFLRSFWRILIARVPNARSCTILACSNICDRKCINAVKFYRILRFLNLNLACGI